jgi:hypothetical protein
VDSAILERHRSAKARLAIENCSMLTMAHCLKGGLRLARDGGDVDDVTALLRDYPWQIAAILYGTPLRASGCGEYWC